MDFSHHLFLLALLLPLAACIDPIYQHCGQNFTDNSILQVNINKAVYSMITNTPDSGYSISTIGNGSNTVYGLTRCRGDIGPKACSDCISAASQDLQEFCPSTSASRIWHDLCFLRYDTTNFLGTIDNSDARGWRSGKEMEDPIKFSMAVTQLLNWVKTGAAVGNNKFGMGKRSIDSSSSLTIYGMAQCTHDLQETTCLQCLEGLTGLMIKYCTIRDGCHYMSSSCLLRFESSNFILASTIPTYPEVDAPTPSPSTIA
ncbi:Cysteine-rich receptor-like protein kinase 29 [Platanthera zijinensis]|uniref:Cysteine-rich receptor-like protein kinase 29 n=1 Tax=Platanthera zijinensis TaxID=2320716 RepID=A0AAP0BPC7_9ASPA